MIIWGVIFNLIDNMIYVTIFEEKLIKKNYILLKFEDVLKDQINMQKYL